MSIPKLDNETIQLAIVAVAGLVVLAVLLQSIILLTISLSVRKAAKAIRKEIEDLHSSVMPIVFNTRDLIASLAPNVESATIDLAEMARGLREKTEEVEFAAAEILERLNQQTVRLDAMLSDALDTVERAGGYVAETVGKPLRQLSGFLAAIRAVADSLRNSG